MMDVNANLEELKTDISARIVASRSNREKDKSNHVRVTVYSVTMSAITTVCVGIATYLDKESFFSSFFTIASLIISASVTVISAWDGIFNFKSLWINSSITLNKLYELDTDIRHAEASNTINQNLTNEFYKCYKKILHDSNSQWLKIRE